MNALELISELEVGVPADFKHIFARRKVQIVVIEAAVSIGGGQARLDMLLLAVDIYRFLIKQIRKAELGVALRRVDHGKFALSLLRYPYLRLAIQIAFVVEYGNGLEMQGEFAEGRGDRVSIRLQHDPEPEQHIVQRRVNLGVRNAAAIDARLPISPRIALIRREGGLHMDLAVARSIALPRHPRQGAVSMQGNRDWGRCVDA